LLSSAVEKVFEVNNLLLQEVLSLQLPPIGLCLKTQQLFEGVTGQAPPGVSKHSNMLLVQLFLQQQQQFCADLNG